MEESKTNTEQTEIVGDSEKSSRETYPIKPFRLIEPFVGNVYKKYGGSGVHSNEKIADANNLSVNSIKQILSTCNQYGAMQRVHGVGYKITDTFTKIFHPENEEERLQAIIDSIKGVPFYVPLFSDYNEKLVPSAEGLQNRFIRDYNMKPHIAKNAADVFLQNLRDFNLVNARGVLIFRPDTKQQPSNVTETSGTNNTVETTKNPSSDEAEDMKAVKIPVRLKSGKMAYLSFPSDFTDEDLIKIFKVLKAYIEAYGDEIDLSKL